MVVFTVSLMPTISTSSPTLHDAALDATRRHRAAPEIVNTSSTGIRNGLSSSRAGVGM
jgi:hypothetical protein